MEKQCIVDGCSSPAKSRGMCYMHYMRKHRNGTTEDSGYGSKTKHPLYITWMSAKRGGVLCQEWKDFDVFLKAVGAKPEGGWRLYRKDCSLPYQESNVQWKKLLFTSQKYGADELRLVRNEHRKAKGRENHDPVAYRKRALFSNHGITVEQYQEMLDSQNGVCAICGYPEKVTLNGKVKPLSVDHCHKTRNSGKGKGVRALLCQACNVGLGKFNDDSELLMKAAEYLKKHQENLIL